MTTESQLESDKSTQNRPIDPMSVAFDLARAAYDAGEVPVGCVILIDDVIVGRGFNQPNKTGNATRHAEFVAVDDAMENFAKMGLKKYSESTADGAGLCSDQSPSSSTPDWSNADVYVTVEPCVMCAAALMELRVASITYGCANERFGGVESVKTVCNDLAKLTTDRNAKPADLKSIEPLESRTLADSKESTIVSGSDFTASVLEINAESASVINPEISSEPNLAANFGCLAEVDYRMPKIVSGIRADEAVQLLRKFYLRGNELAPRPKRPRKD